MKFLSLMLLVAVALPGCVSHTRCDNLNGLTDNEGKEVVYQQTSTIALHTIFGIWPMAGDAGLVNSVNEFTAHSAESGDSQLAITQSSSSNYWWVLFPITVFVTPVTSDVYGVVR